MPPSGTSSVRSSALARDGGTGSLCPSPEPEEDDADPPRPDFWVLLRGIGCGGRWWLLGLVKRSEKRKEGEGRGRGWPRDTPSINITNHQHQLRPSTIIDQSSSITNQPYHHIYGITRRNPRFHSRGGHIIFIIIQSETTNHHPSTNINH